MKIVNETCYDTADLKNRLVKKGYGKKFDRVRFYYAHGEVGGGWSHVNGRLPLPGELADVVFYLPRKAALMAMMAPLEAVAWDGKAVPSRLVPAMIPLHLAVGQPREPEPPIPITRRTKAEREAAKALREEDRDRRQRARGAVERQKIGAKKRHIEAVDHALRRAEKESAQLQVYIESRRRDKGRLEEELRRMEGKCGSGSTTCTPEAD